MKLFLKQIICIQLHGSPYGVVANVLDCNYVVSEFKLQVHYYVHFQSNILGKGMNSFTAPVMGSTSIFLQGWQTRVFMV